MSTTYPSDYNNGFIKSKGQAGKKDEKEPATPEVEEKVVDDDPNVYVVQAEDVPKIVEEILESPPKTKEELDAEMEAHCAEQGNEPIEFDSLPIEEQEAILDGIAAVDNGIVSELDLDDFKDDEDDLEESEPFVAHDQLPEIIKQFEELDLLSDKLFKQDS
jgi:hypothetical protein